MTKRLDIPRWPTRRHNAYLRRSRKRAGITRSGSPRASESPTASWQDVAATYPQVADEPHEPVVVITTLWDGIGQAYVKLGGKRVVVQWGAKYWACHQCGRQDEPTCEHARLIPNSAALRHAQRIRNISTPNERESTS